MPKSPDELKKKIYLKLQKKTTLRIPNNVMKMINETTKNVRIQFEKNVFPNTGITFSMYLLYAKGLYRHKYPHFKERLKILVGKKEKIFVIFPDNFPPFLRRLGVGEVDLYAPFYVHSPLVSLKKKKKKTS